MSMCDFRDLAELLQAKIIKELPIIRGRAVEGGLVGQSAC